MRAVKRDPLGSLDLPDLEGSGVSRPLGIFGLSENALFDWRKRGKWAKPKKMHLVKGEQVVL